MDRLLALILGFVLGAVCYDLGDGALNRSMRAKLQQQQAIEKAQMESFIKAHEAKNAAVEKLVEQLKNLPQLKPQVGK